VRPSRLNSKAVELDRVIRDQRRDHRRKRKHPQFGHGRPPMNSRTWCLSRSCIRTNRSLPFRLARCSAASPSSTAKTARRIADRLGRWFSEYSTWRGHSVGHPFVVSARPPDLLDRAKHLLDSANVNEPPGRRSGKQPRPCLCSLARRARQLTPPSPRRPWSPGVGLREGTSDAATRAVVQSFSFELTAPRYQGRLRPMGSNQPLTNDVGP